MWITPWILEYTSVLDTSSLDPNIPMGDIHLSDKESLEGYSTLDEEELPNQRMLRDNFSTEDISKAHIISPIS